MTGGRNCWLTTEFNHTSHEMSLQDLVHETLCVKSDWSFKSTQHALQHTAHILGVLHSNESGETLGYEYTNGADQEGNQGNSICLQFACKHLRGCCTQASKSGHAYAMGKPILRLSCTNQEALEWYDHLTTIRLRFTVDMATLKSWGAYVVCTVECGARPLSLCVCI